MTVTNYEIDTVATGYDLVTGLIATYGDPAETGRYGKSITNFTEMGSSFALGGGVFLTASHLFDIVAQSVSGNLIEFKANTATLGGQPITGHFDLRGYNAIAANKNLVDGTSTNDIAIVKTTATVPSSSLAPLVVFFDQTAAGKFLTGKIITNNGLKTANSGFLIDIKSGEFSTQFNTKSGDSGAAASIELNNKSYAVGVLSHSGTTDSTYSYLDQATFYKAISVAEAGSQDWSQAPRDLLIGSGSNEYIRGSKRRASILDGGDNTIILAGSGGDIINDGQGKNDVILLPGAAGESDPGTTVVVSPGSKIVAGGGPNDRLVILSDRLVGGGDAQSNSDYYQISHFNKNIYGPPSAFTGYSLLGTDGAVTGAVYAYMRGNDLDLVISALNRPSSTIHGNSTFFGNFQQFFGGNSPGAAFTAADQLWTSVVRLKDFKSGDFGLTFPDKNSSFLQLTASDPTSIYDDPSQSWSSAVSNPFFQPDQTIANHGPTSADLAAVLAATTYGPLEFDPLTPAPPTPAIAIAAIDDQAAQENQPLTVAALASATETGTGGAALSLASGASALHGSVSVQDGTLIYTPDTDYVGADTVSFAVSDGSVTAAGSFKVAVAGYAHAEAKTLADGSAQTRYYDAAGSNYRSDVDLMGGGHSISYFGFTGQPYMSETTLFDAAWHPIGETRYTADGGVYASSSVSTDSAGAVTTSQFDGDGALVSALTTFTDGRQDSLVVGTAADPFTTYVNHSDAAGHLTSETVSNRDGTVSEIGFDDHETISAGAGSATLIGLGYGDTFSIGNRGATHDDIRGFAPGQGTVQIDHTLFNDFGAFFAAASDAAGGLVATAGNGATLTLEGLARSQLSVGDFRFV